jgi:hypothetical protein
VDGSAAMASSRRVLPAVIVLLGVGPVPPDLSVRASPAYGTGPCDVRISVRVAPNDENRLLRVAIDSGAYYRSSDFTLPGAAASERHLLSWRAVPSGRYLVTVTLYGAYGVRHTVTTWIDLLGFR